MMQTIETTHIEPEAQLSSCPFCGAEPFWLGHVIRGPSGRVAPHFYHPGVATDTDCVLSGKGYSLDEVGAWNTRSSAPQEPDDALIAELRRYATGNNNDEYGRGWNCAMEEAESIVRRLRVAQEPVADDDALIGRLRQIVLDAEASDLQDDELFKWDGEEPVNLCVGDLRAILDRLQAKAPETGEG